MTRFNRESVGLPKSTVVYLLKSLIPYSKPNLKLTFRPSDFFADLEKISRINKANAKNAYYRAIRSGDIEIGDDGVPRLTQKGMLKIKPFKARRIKKGGCLIIVFDIPETQKQKRNKLRTILKTNKFRQVQKSVWISDYDYREAIQMEIEQQRLRPFVQIFEAARIDK